MASTPRPVYDRMQAEAPLHYVEEYDTWAVLGFDAVRQICLDTTNFTCTRGQTPNQVMLDEPTGHTFPELDPPQHRPRRRVLAGDYTPDAARRDAPWIRALAQEVLAPLLAHGPTTIDAYVDYASRVTARRYLEYLADAGTVTRAPRYGTPGRPENEYGWNRG